MVAGKGHECTHSPALVARVYYGRPVLTVIGSDEPFETSNREIRRGGEGQCQKYGSSSNIKYGVPIPAVGSVGVIW